MPSYREELIQQIVQGVFEKHVSQIQEEIKAAISEVMPEVSVQAGRHSGKLVHVPAYGPTNDLGVAGSMALADEMPPKVPVQRLLISGVLADLRWPLGT